MDSYSMEGGGNSIRNPYQERMLEKISLPKNLVKVYLLAPYLKEVIAQSSKYKPDYSTAYLDLKIPIVAYNTYDYAGSKATKNYVKLERFEIADGPIDISGGLTNYTWRVLCDTLILPASIKSVSNLMFREAKDSNTGSEWTFNEASYIVCKAATPPTLTYDSQLNKKCFYTWRTTGNSDSALTYTITNPLYVPAESVDLYKAAVGWKQFKTILPIDK